MATLVAYWKLDEASGTTAADSAGSSPLTLNGGGFTRVSPPAAISFTDANALLFDGSNSFTAGAATGLPNVNAALSLSLWVKFTGTSGTQQLLVLTDSGLTGFLQIAERGALLRAERGGSNAISDGPAVPTDGLWHHLAYTQDPTGSVTTIFYFDGTAYPMTGATLDIAATDYVAMSTWYPFGGPLEPLDGALDDVRVYSGILTSGEVATLAAGNELGGGNTMTVAGTAPVATSAIALASTDSLTVAGTAPVATSAIALASTDSLTVAATVPVATSAIALGSTDVLTVAGVAPVATMAATLISPDRVITVAATVPVATSATALASTDALTVSGVAPVATSAIALVSTDSIAIAATVPVSTMAATLTAGQNNVAVDATVPPPTCAAALASTDFLAVAATVPGATMAANLTAPYVVTVASVVPVATMVAGLTVPVVYVDPGSPWARILKPRYARWRRRTDGRT